ncbi:hypothetical protein VB816_21970 [Limnoraphis robusta CCNP1324]|uniref:hypothetical protein n=1 Tax=Limnoraphis robusta TaxID=1118279 RepID=UPI002B1F33E5|nr:hypothetical protein [Limnoraphis robusta]MEA5547652.1 hypothetical protein [Limnoraphis robusta CCNP1324]
MRWRPQLPERARKGIESTLARGRRDPAPGVRVRRGEEPRERREAWDRLPRGAGVVAGRQPYAASCSLAR